MWWWPATTSRARAPPPGGWPTTHSWCGIPTPWRLTRTAGCWRREAGNEPAAGRPAVRGAAGRIGGAVQPVRDRRLRRGGRRAVVGVAAAARHVRLVRRDQRAAGVPGQPVRVGAGADADLERPSDPAARHRDHPGGAGVRGRRRAAPDRIGDGRRRLRAAGRRRPRAGGAGPGGTELGHDRGAGLAVAADAGAGRDRHRHLRRDRHRDPVRRLPLLRSAGRSVHGGRPGHGRAGRPGRSRRRRHGALGEAGAMSHAVRMHDVRYRYPDAARPALDGVSLDVEQGELVLVLGESGSGKSTLLRAALGLVPSFHGGELAGRVVSEGLDTREHSPAQVARHVGLVFQDPESQLVMRRADHEVAFGLENLGCDPREILPRAEQALTAVAAGHLAERETGKLSGGEQQRVAIASVLAMGQSTLLLDEPTSQLDPIAAEELLALVTRINRDRGITVMLAEHRTSRIFAEADRVVVMEAGRIVFDGSPAEAAVHLAGSTPWLLPPVTQAFVAAHRPELPLTVRDARRLAAPAPPSRRELPAAATVVGLTSVTKRYGDIPALRGATTALRAGTVTALVGPNGAGKSTLARIATGLEPPDGGRVEGDGVRGYVSQNPAHHAVRERVDDEVAYALENLGVAAPERSRRVAAELARFGLEELAERHPRDLSSGERQRLAIASVMVMRPKLLVLDEPTRGMDGLRKLALAELVGRLAEDGCGVIVVTHDIDFAAEAAEAVTTMARGRVLADGCSVDLLAHGGFFACQAGLALGCTTIAEAGALLRTETERAGV